MSPLFVFAHFYPRQFFLTVLAMLALSLLAWIVLRVLSKKNYISKRKSNILWCLAAYTLFLLYITTFGRLSIDHHRINLHVGYSYRMAFIDGNFEMMQEILLNILIFIPLGIVCAFAFRRFRLLLSGIYGFGLSAFIELSQYYLRKGTFEYDDLISNTLGTLIGCIIVLTVLEICSFWRKHRANPKQKKFHEE